MIAETLSKMDTALFYSVNHGLQNPVFDLIMPFLTHLRHWAPLIAILALWGLWKDWRKTCLVLGFCGAVMVTTDAISSGILKNIWDRPRPCVALPDVHLLVSLKHSHSMPSSHALNTSCLAAILYIIFPRAFVLAAGIGIALLIGFTRVYIGVHYPFDVLAGYGIGAVFGAVAGQSYKLFVPGRLLLDKKTAGENPI